MATHREWCIRLAGRLFCLALAIFLYTDVVPTSGFIADIYEDHAISFESETLKINHTVNVHENATLTIQPGVNIVFSGNGSFTVHGNLVANGTQTLPIDLSSEIGQNFNSSKINAIGLSSLRLVDGNGFRTGRLEVFHAGIWGTVCDDGWSQINSIVACRGLGFSTGTFTREYPGGRGQIWLDDVDCRESDRSLKLCKHLGFGIHDCGHSEDVGLRCTGTRLNQELHNISRSLLRFVGKGKSSLKNVRIHAVQQYQAENSSSKFSISRAIVCDGGCPYITNLNITGFAAALEIRNYGDILLRNMKIMNCFYGVVALNNEANSTSIKALSKSHNDTDIFRLEKITVNNSHMGVVLENHYFFPIELREIVITNCYSGVFVSKTMFTKVKISELMFDTGVNAIIIRTTPGYFEHVDLCDDGYNLYNASFPVEISHFSYTPRSPCSMVS